MRIGTVVWLLVIAGCSSGSSSNATKSPVDSTHSTNTNEASVCSYPAGVGTDRDASATGCFGGPSGKSCLVSNGAHILADGGVENGTESCSSLCDPSEFELSCYGMVEADVPIPDPDPALGCKVIPMPTPAGALFYCCPCAP